MRISLITIFTFISILHATVHNVPDDFGTIQLAIVNASSGDTIVVADGTYTGSGNKDIDFYGKSLYLKSQNGYEHTTIDCEGDGRGFYFHLFEDSTSIVDGFTIISGHTGNSGEGGGVKIDYSSPKIINTKITGCYAPKGGGIYVGTQSLPIFENCILDNNGSGGSGNYVDQGGNGYIISGGLIMRNSVIENGYAATAGGLYFTETDNPVTISNCEFLSNQVQGTNYNYAGAIYFAGDSLFLNGCYFYNNSGYRRGGALNMSSNAYVGITNSRFKNNYATSGDGDGGAIYQESGTLIISSSTFLNNYTYHSYSGSDGGTIYTSSNNAILRIANTLIAKGHANRYGGIYFLGDSISIEHSTIVHNDWENSGDGGSADVYVYGNSSESYFKNSIIPSYYKHSSAPDIIVENIYTSESSAQFIDYENDDYRLGVHSPAIGFGGPTDLTHDIIGNPRINPTGSNPDAGCYESPLDTAMGVNTYLYVTPSGNDSTGSGQESSPFGSIGFAINNAQNTDTVIVGPGAYVESGITVSSNVYVRSQEGSDNTTMELGENRIYAYNEALTLEGFNITSTNEYPIYFEKSGSYDLKLLDIMIDQKIRYDHDNPNYSAETSSEFIINDLQSNHGIDFVYNYDGSYSNQGVDCDFTNLNITVDNGEIFTITPGNDWYRLVFVLDIDSSYLVSNDYIFSENISYNNNYPSTITGSISNSYLSGRFQHNNAPTNNTSFVLSNSVFDNSILSFQAFSSYNSRLTIDRCTFNNVTITHDGWDATQIKNSIFWPSLIYNDANNNSETEPQFKYCLNAPDYGTGNIAGDPLFVDIDSGDFSLFPASPAIDTGDPLDENDPDSTRADMGGLYFDQSGEYHSTMISVDDVVDDQGGAVRLNWTSSPNDIQFGNITHYGIWRVLNDGTNDGLGQVPAVQAEQYQFVAVTLRDSISTGTNWERFFITAHTNNPWVFYTSGIDSGYSVDNIPPFAPQELNTVIDADGLTASWLDTDNPDIYYYEVYKNGELFLETTETQFTDNFEFGSSAVYTIRGIDENENIGDFSEPFEITNGQLGDVTWDGTIDVLDVLNVADIIITGASEFNEGELWAADLNGDATTDVFDLVQLVDEIMGGGSARVLESNARVAIFNQGTSVYLSSSSPVQGLELTLSSAVSGIVDQTGFVFHHENNKVLMYSMGDQFLSGNKVTLFDLPDGVTIASAKVSGPGGQRYEASVGVVPESFVVHQNYPNPFNPSTSVQIDLPELSRVSVVIYDAVGREVQKLVNEEFLPGYHTLSWKGTDYSGRQVASGIYFIRVSTPGNTKTIKAMLIR